MTVKAVCSIVGVHRDPDNHAHFTCTVSYAALIDTSIVGTTTVVDLDPSALGSVLAGGIEAAVKTFLIGEGVTFGLLDTVRLLPGML